MVGAKQTKLQQVHLRFIQSRGFEQSQLESQIKLAFFFCIKKEIAIYIFRIRKLQKGDSIQ